jgi:hypothetical protein
MKDSFITTLEDIFKDEFTNEVKNIWDRVLTRAITVMANPDKSTDFSAADDDMCT